MKERPILFSAPMVRALLAGTKTQTRRALRNGTWWTPEHGVIRMAPAGLACTGFAHVACPYGVPGDRLWVRETFAGSIAYERHGYALKDWGNKLWYVADGEPRSGQWTRPRPSIHMPRCLSRITLEVTGVRVERLQDISEADAVAEGTPCYVCGGPMDGLSESDCHCFHRKAAASDYRGLWGSINGAGSWDANPWVWVVEFKRLEG